jgi:NADH-quinone oxidoreductase subunit L
MTRLYCLTFLGSYRGPTSSGHDEHSTHGHGEKHGHGAGRIKEAPLTMLIPVLLLGLLSGVGGYLGLDHKLYDFFAHQLSAIPAGEASVFAEAHQPHAGWVMVLSGAIGIGGILAGLWAYLVAPSFPRRLAESLPNLHTWVSNKYYVDEIYEASVLRPMWAINQTAGEFDNNVIDAAVNQAASGTGRTSQGTGYFDNEAVDGTVNWIGDRVLTTGRVVRRMQSGNIRSYVAAAVAGGVVIMALLTLWPRFREWLDPLTRFTQ